MKHLAILGGGIAGLSVGYYAKKNGIPFTIYEEKARIGGNAITFKHSDFFFDSGAHRIHDKDPKVTKEIYDLLKLGESKTVNAHDLALASDQERFEHAFFRVGRRDH